MSNCRAADHRNGDGSGVHPPCPEAVGVVGQNGCRELSSLFDRIEQLLQLHDRVFVAIDGNSGAGKSSLAALLSQSYDCNVFHMDDFFLPPALKTSERLAEAGGNVDYVRFRQEVLTGLQSGDSFHYRRYDCRQQALGLPLLVIPKRLNVIEGVYSMHPTLIDLYHLKVFLSLDPEEQLRRIERRNGFAMLQRFMHEWIPLENRYFSQLQVAARSDLVFHL